MVRNPEEFPRPALSRKSILALFAVISASQAVCATTLSRMYDGKREEMTEIQGFPEVGTVFYLRQMHGNPDIPIESVGPIAKYQVNIIEELNRLSVTDIFVEGLTIDIDNHELDTSPAQFLSNKQGRIPSATYSKLIQWKTQTKSLRALVHEYLYQFRGAPVSQEGQEFLAQVGAPLVYACFNPKINLHSAENIEATHIGGQMMRDSKKNLNPDYEIVMNDGRRMPIDFEALHRVRERVAKNLIMNFLNQNPGKKVVLIYGGWHELKDDFEQLQKPPRLISIDF